MNEKQIIEQSPMQFYEGKCSLVDIITALDFDAAGQAVIAVCDSVVASNFVYPELEHISKFMASHLMQNWQE